MIRITCPIDPRLHAHNSGNWRAKADATKEARDAAYILTRSALMVSPKIMGTAILDIKFTVPNRRRRDMLNMCQSLKPVIDGAVDAGGIEGDHWEVLRIGEITVVLGDRLEAELIFRCANSPEK